MSKPTSKEFMKENVMKEVIDGIMSVSNKRNHELYDEIVNKDFEADVTKTNIGDFYISFIYPFENYLEVMLKNKLNLNEDASFLVINSEFFSRHFQELFQKYEGSFACADKTNTVLNSIYRFLKTAEPINFNYDQEYTYHLPKTILKTHDDIIALYKGLKSLLSGRPEKYINYFDALREANKQQTGKE
jgi:hypothetical protein